MTPSLADLARLAAWGVEPGCNAVSRVGIPQASRKNECPHPWRRRLVGNVGHSRKDARPGTQADHGGPLRAGRQRAGDGKRRRHGATRCGAPGRLSSWLCAFAGSCARETGRQYASFATPQTKLPVVDAAAVPAASATATSASAPSGASNGAPDDEFAAMEAEFASVSMVPVTAAAAASTPAVAARPAPMWRGSVPRSAARFPTGVKSPRLTWQCVPCGTCAHRP